MRTAILRPLPMLSLLVALCGCRSPLRPDPQPAQLTHGPGNDTEPAWSSDGRMIAFQTDRHGDMDICLLRLDTGQVSGLVTGPGDACFPSWSPDGGELVYCAIDYRGSATEEVAGSGCNLFIVDVASGIRRRLTSGRHRDLTPVFTPTGDRIVFASTRGADKHACMRLYAVPRAGGEPEVFEGLGGNRDAAWMQPTFSPSGTHYAAGFVMGLRDNWSIHVGMAGQSPKRKVASDLKGPLYGPRWAPGSRELLACTGFQPGDRNWQVYLVEAFGDGLHRLTTGPGNSRSATWSPEGKHIVFENNRSGSYKLYRMDVPPMQGPPVTADPLAWRPRVRSSASPETAPLAFDGDRADRSHWFCVGLNQWIEAEFPVEQTVCAIRVHSGFLDYWKNPSGTQSLAGYRVQVWQDDSWRDLGGPEGPVPAYAGEERDAFHSECRFAAVTADRFRILVTASHDTLRRIRSPNTPCVNPEDAATYVREIEFVGVK